MDRLSLCFGLALGLCALAGCDQKNTKTSPSAEFDASDPKNAPVPARFGARAEPLWQAPEPIALASTLPLTAAPASDLAGDQTGRRIFDGERTPPVSAPVRAQTSGGRTPIVWSNRQMSIDTDGIVANPALARRIRARDRWHKDNTAWHYTDGRPLDATRVPYIVLPLGYHDAELGDLALVEYRGRKIWAVCGDRGPADRFGEASPAVAEALGIDPDAGRGGVQSGVTYTLFPGSGKGRQPSEAALLAFLSRPG